MGGAEVRGVEAAEPAREVGAVPPLGVAVALRGVEGDAVRLPRSPLIRLRQGRDRPSKILELGLIGREK